jgi:hypothetical protein
MVDDIPISWAAFLYLILTIYVGCNALMRRNYESIWATRWNGKYGRTTLEDM